MFKTTLHTGLIKCEPGAIWDELDYESFEVTNMYVDMKGQLRPKQFPKEGLWKYDGQAFYLPKKGKESTAI